MAEHGAHITSSAVEQPSIFEVLAQEGLTDSLKLALKYSLRILAQSHPARLGFVFKYADEISLAFSTFLESYFLKHYNSSFAENFYGLKRCETNPNVTSHIYLTRKAHYKSLIMLVLVPYVKEKLNKIYRELIDKEDRGLITGNQNTIRLKMEQFFIKIYPWIHFIWEVLNFGLLFAYVVGKSKYHSALLWLSKIRLQTLTENDIERHQRLSDRKLDLTNKSLLQAALAIIGLSGGVLAKSVTSALSVGVFFLQFLQQWYAAPVTSVTSLPTPAPPSAPSKEKLPKIPNICPLCNKLRTNDTVLVVSGYVFCYLCIYKFVDEHSRCPVTYYPATADHLVRIYLQDP